MDFQVVQFFLTHSCARAIEDEERKVRPKGDFATPVPVEFFDPKRKTIMEFSKDKVESQDNRATQLFTHTL